MYQPGFSSQTPTVIRVQQRAKDSIITAKHIEALSRFFSEENDTTGGTKHQTHPEQQGSSKMQEKMPAPAEQIAIVS